MNGQKDWNAFHSLRSEMLNSAALRTAHGHSGSFPPTLPTAVSSTRIKPIREDYEVFLNSHYVCDVYH